MMKKAPCPLACLLIWPGEARADWPEFRHVVSTVNSQGPFGAAIRQWGPLDEVFILAEMHDEPNDERWAHLYWATCSDGDGCASDTLNYDAAESALVTYGNLTQPSMAVRRTSANNPVEVLLTMRQDLQDDCDGDGFEAGDGDPDDQTNLDLQGLLWSTDSGGGVDTSWAIQVNDTSPGCEDHGVSYSRFRANATPHACFTQKAAGTDDEIVCDDGSSATWQWLNAVAMDNDGEVEDHPSFEFYGSGNELVVSGTQRRAGLNPYRARVHFPDHTAPPSEPIVSFDATANKLDYTSLAAAGGELHMVWVDDEAGDASILYQSCDHSSTVDCTDSADWLSNPEVVIDSTTGYNFDAQFSQIEVDDDGNQFVVFQYDADTSANDQWRVMVASRCAGGAWNYEQVRTPSTSDRDQVIATGRPSLVLNRDERVAHVVFAEMDDYTGRWSFVPVTNGDLYWYRKEYTACP